MYNVFTVKNVIIVYNHTYVHIKYLWKSPLEARHIGTFVGEGGGLQVNESHAFHYMLIVLNPVKKGCITTLYRKCKL